MGSHSTIGLPSYRGRAPRIAFVVFNDTYGDTRVLKIAESAARAGADVRIFAFGGRGSRFPVGLEHRSYGVDIERLHLIQISYLLPRWGLALRRLFRRPLPQYVDPRTLSIAESSQAIASIAEGQPVGFTGAVKRWTIDTWGRANATLRQLSFWARAQPAILAWKPDLIHAHDANTLIAAGRASRRLKVPFVYDSHELWTHRNVSSDRPIAKRLEGPVERYWARRAARVTTVSPSIADWLCRTYRLDNMPVLVRNIPPYSGSVPARAEGQLRKMAGLDATASIVAYCGGITSNRGLEEAVDALKYLPEKVHLVMLGDGSDTFRISLYERAERNNVTKRVHFAGSVASDAVASALADADVSLVLTRPTCLSYEYSLPNKLFESIHGGLPVVSSDLVDAAQLVRSYGVGAIVAVSATPKELAQGVQKVISGTNDYHEAAKKASSELTWQNESDRLLTVYCDALGIMPAAEGHQDVRAAKP